MTGPLLVIDASTYRGTVAVVRGGEVLAEAEATMRGEREERLMPAAAATLGEAGLVPADIAGVVCGAGPGSFTSLRIAASIAKAIALSEGVSLFGVSSLLLIIAGQPAPPAAGRYLAAIDAMRDELFAARCVVSPDHGAVLEGPVELLSSQRLRGIAAEEGRTTVGPGCELGWAPHARGVARLGPGTSALAAVDLTTWEPQYGRLAEAQVQWERKHGRSLTG